MNGFFAAMFAQFFLFCGAVFAGVSLADCSLVETVEPPPYDEEPFLGLADARRLFDTFGLLTFAKPNGDCYFYGYGDDPKGQFDYYFQTFAADFNVGFAFGVVGFLGGSIMFFYSLSLACSAQNSGLRYFAALIVTFLLPTVESLVFLVFNTDFCDANSCVIARTGYFVITSAGCYFVAGIFLFCLSEYPGAERLREEKEYLYHHAHMQEQDGDEENHGVARYVGAVDSPNEDEHPESAPTPTAEEEIVEVEAAILPGDEDKEKSFPETPDEPKMFEENDPEPKEMTTDPSPMEEVSVEK